MKMVGIVLVVIGIVGLAYGGITWTRRDTVVDMGPVEITSEKRESLPLPPVAGGLCLVVGAALLLASGRRA